MELRVLRYFLAVAREQNITRAAEALHVTQPTLSKQLMDLEEELGQNPFRFFCGFYSFLQLSCRFCPGRRRAKNAHKNAHKKTRKIVLSV